MNIDVNTGFQLVVRANESNNPLKSNYYDPLSDLIKVYKNTKSKTSSDYYKITDIGNRIIFNFKNIELFLECHGSAQFSSCFNSEKDKIIIILDNNKEHINSVHALAKAINQLKNVRQIRLTFIQFKNWPTEYSLDKLAENVEIDEMMLPLFRFLNRPMPNFSTTDDKIVLLNVFKKITIALRKNKNDLDLSDMKLSILPEELSSFFAGFESIRLNKNLFSAIPHWFTQLCNDLKNLTTLDLSDNQIVKLPSTINSLTSITNLNLAKNQLSEIPENMRDLSTLKSLNLSENPIEKLEDDSLPPNLEELNISDTEITRLPLSFTNRNIQLYLDQEAIFNFGENTQQQLKIFAYGTRISTDWKKENQDLIQIDQINETDQMNEGEKKVLKKRLFDQGVTTKPKKPKFD